MTQPQSGTPTGVPESGGNAKYAIIAVVLVLGTAAIFAWRSFTNRDQQPAPPPPPSAIAAIPPTATNPKLDDIPPPPPIEEKPEAGPAGGRITYVVGGGCEGKCAGVSPPELVQALQVRGAQARRCYNSALASDSTLRGHVTMAVRVGPSGNVCSANVAANDMGSAGVAACAANIFRNASYPAPRGGCVDVTIPLSFVPMGSQ